MLTEWEKFRERARHCRSLAAAALDPAIEDNLLALAEEFEEAAERLEEQAQPKTD